MRRLSRLLLKCELRLGRSRIASQHAPAEERARIRRRRQLGGPACKLFQRIGVHHDLPTPDPVDAVRRRFTPGAGQTPDRQQIVVPAPARDIELPVIWPLTRSMPGSAKPWKRPRSVTSMTGRRSPGNTSAARPELVCDSPWSQSRSRRLFCNSASTSASPTRQSRPRCPDRIDATDEIEWRRHVVDKHDHDEADAGDHRCLGPERRRPDNPRAPVFARQHGDVDRSGGDAGRPQEHRPGVADP